MSTDTYLNDSDGTPLYVVTERNFGRTTEWMVKAASLKEAKEGHGWTRMRYTTRSVRRARQSDGGLVVDS